MRLIDADKVNFNEVFVGASEFAQDTRYVAQILINRQPIAYDVDKVVEQLEERSEEYNSGVRCMESRKKCLRMKQSRL